MSFEILGKIEAIVTIATGRGIRELKRLRKFYGGRRWRKRKGTATVRFPDGTIWEAEVHWYECHGLGREEMKVKRIFKRVQ